MMITTRLWALEKKNVWKKKCLCLISQSLNAAWVSLVAHKESYRFNSHDLLWAPQFHTWCSERQWGPTGQRSECLHRCVSTRPLCCTAGKSETYELGQPSVSWRFCLLMGWFNYFFKIYFNHLTVFYVFYQVLSIFSPYCLKCFK